MWRKWTILMSIYFLLSIFFNLSHPKNQFELGSTACNIEIIYMYTKKKNKKNE